MQMKLLKKLNSKELKLKNENKNSKKLVLLVVSLYLNTPLKTKKIQQKTIKLILKINLLRKKRLNSKKLRL